MIYWAPFLHFYQPPIQSHAVLKKICNESYRPLVKLFHTHPSAKVTINISGVLTELLMDHGGEDIVKGLKALAQNGQVEFVGSAKYHAILPLVPEDEIKRQIELNEKAGILFYRNTYRPSGFFPPEMCYSRKILQPIADAGYGWLLISGVACSKSWPMDKIYRVKAEGSNLCVLFRDDILSNKISFHNIDSKGFLQHLSAFYRNHNINKKEGSRKDIYVITAMDAETFGHHIKNWDKTFLQEVYEAIAVMDNTRRQLKEKRGSLKRQGSCPRSQRV